MAVTNIAELNALVERVKKAQREYASFTQEQVDKIFRAAALAAADARIPLAKMAVAESGMGIVASATAGSGADSSRHGRSQYSSRCSRCASRCASWRPAAVNG